MSSDHIRLIGFLHAGENVLVYADKNDIAPYLIIFRSAIDTAVA